VYVGCSLNDAPAPFVEEVGEFKQKLGSNGYKVLEFIGKVNGTVRDVYEWDINCVRQCDLFVAVCDFPSTGLGIELNEAVRLEKPTLAVANHNTRVSRMVLGMAEVEPNITFSRYYNLLAILPEVDALQQQTA
jgi:nucleoside 2-deoxyribosyltransferase